jgi:hypothetical protein
MQPHDGRAVHRRMRDTRQPVLQRPRVPVGRPALPQAQAPGHEHGDDLVAVAQAHEVPGQVDRGAHLGRVDIDDQEIGRLAHGDLAGQVVQAHGARAFVRGVVEPGPAAAARRIADGQAEGQFLRGLGRVHQAEGVAAGGVGAQPEADAHGGHQVRGRHGVALPLAGDRVVAHGGVGVAQQHELGRRDQRAVRDEHLRAQRAQLRQQFERPLAALHHRALDRCEVLVDVRLENGARLGAQRRHGGEHVVGGGLGHRDGERGMHQLRVRPLPQEACGVRLDGLPVGGGAVVAAVVADQAQHAAQPGLLHGGRNGADVARRARARIAHGGEAAAQRFERRELGGHVDELVVQARLQRHPHAPEDFGRLAIGQRLAEGLREVVVRVDHSRHQQLAGQLQRREVRVAGEERGGGADIAKPAARNSHGMAGRGAVAQHQVVGNEQQLVGGEERGIEFRRHGEKRERENRKGKKESDAASTATPAPPRRFRRLPGCRQRRG